MSADLGAIFTSISSIVGSGNSIYQTASGQNANNNSTQLGVANTAVEVEKQKNIRFQDYFKMETLKNMKPTDYAKIALIGIIVIFIVFIAVRKKD